MYLCTWNLLKNIFPKDKNLHTNIGKPLTLPQIPLAMGYETFLSSESGEKCKVMLPK